MNDSRHLNAVKTKNKVKHQCTTQHHIPVGSFSVPHLTALQKMTE